MNTGTVVYRNPSRMQLLDERHHREELHNRFKGALEQIHIIEMACENKVSDEPTACVDELRNKVDKLFSDIPEEYLTKESKAKKRQMKEKGSTSENVTSRIENKNPNYDAAVQERSGSQRPKVKNPHEAIVATKKPLMLSWDANLALTGKRPGAEKNTATSQYAAFSQPTGATLETPQENPRKEIQAKREKELAKFTPIDKTRKAKILEVKPRPASAKMPADFVPNCAAVDTTTGAERRREVQAKNDQRKGSLAGAKHFR